MDLGIKIWRIVHPIAEDFRDVYYLGDGSVTSVRRVERCDILREYADGRKDGLGRELDVFG